MFIVPLKLNSVAIRWKSNVITDTEEMKESNISQFKREYKKHIFYLYLKGDNK